MFVLFLGINPISFKLLKWLVGRDDHGLILGDKNQLGSLQKTISKEEYLKFGSMLRAVETEQELAPEIQNYPKIDICFSIGAPWILSKKVIELVFNDKIINVHGTHLPRYRGGTLFSWQILTGQRTGICLIHQLTERIDAGPILSYKEFIYPPSCRSPIDYIKIYEEYNSMFLIKYIEKWQGWPMSYISQPEYLSSYFPRLLASVHGWINWDLSNIELERFIMAFDDPYSGARCKLNGETVVLRDVYAQQMDGYFHPLQYGMIYRNNGSWISVAAKNGEILVKKVFNESGMDITEMVRVGDRFYTGSEELSLAFQRVVKTKSGLKVR